ncbi:hypothetical protein COB47_1601 [Caldicellulosiruptor obsidiansis OB47]|uniref:Uncharacterized protein n=2 Tax=Caldicellulosiruptor TaxID=44000 RepID=E4Q3C8_CALOW|nr:hypothetical protein COB47_1601 [Caldicellulosiruptor obsidiansis OB47]ADQ05077.1 hypothetical protein Calow_1531 [Caldicellulosiruptor owensensis OL]
MNVGLRRSRYKRYCEYKNFIERIRRGLILVVVFFLIMLFIVELSKQKLLPHDEYILKILFSYDNVNLKFAGGRFSIKISKNLPNRFYKKTNYLIFKSKGYLFSLVGNN